MKKVFILTHKLGFNYGGILQAYALQRMIREYGNNKLEIGTGHLHPHASLYIRLRSSVYWSLKRKNLYINSATINRFTMRHTNNFTKKYINIVDLKKYQDETILYIVGSDQVWRAAYVDPVRYMFGSIKNGNAKRISYAASFGTDDLAEYSPEQIQATAILASKFSGISVREESGVGIVKQAWGQNAFHHVDPTFLISPDDYSQLIDTEQTDELEGKLFAYVLDRSITNNTIIQKIAKITRLKQFELMPKEYRSYIDFLRNKDAYIMPKVEQWLKSFRDAQFVVTDSFHGTVFSIIFNKPFIVVGNKARGLARFSSLLSLFGLENRLVTSPDDVTQDLISSGIDWDGVNVKIKSEQKRSSDYLKKYLG